MSDLIERLEKLKNHLRPYEDDRESSIMRLNTEEIDAILSAMKDQETVRGIEGLAKTADGEYARPGLKVRCPNGHTYTYRLFDPMNGRIYCLEGECWSDGCQGDSGSGTHWDSSHVTTLSAAVEAARAGKGDEE